MDLEVVTIIGVGAEGRAGLSPNIRTLIEQADELWGGERLLAQWPDFQHKKVYLCKQLTTTLMQLTKRPDVCHIVVLASGDPGFFGIAASVLKILPAQEVVIYPQVSFLQTAFARISVPWNDAAFASAHARPMAEVIGLARRFPKLGILTDPVQNPSRIAETLLSAGISDCRAVVIENLGETDQKIIDARLADLCNMHFAPLNVLLLIHDPGWKPSPAFSPRPDSAYQHKNGLITKRDVRLMSIGRLEICETDVIWDIGAGSGAVSIEMAEIAWRGKVFAIEKDRDCLDCLHENVSRFCAVNVFIVEGEAPQMIEGLPAPSAVFIGGSGGSLVDILTQIERSARDNCRVVANFALLENLVSALTWMKAHGWMPTLTEVHFSYGSVIGEGTRLAPANPVFILSGIIRRMKGI